MIPARPQRRRVTLASIAAELGISRTTVSNAYNRPDQLADETRKRIFDTAERLGYTGPDALARSLRTRRNGTVGLILTEELDYAFRDPAAVDFLIGLAQSCQDNQTGLVLIPAVVNASEMDAHTTVNNAVVDGFIVYSVAETDPYLTAIRSRDVPVVICDQPKKFDELPRVGINDFLAAQPLGEHLGSLGHRHVGIITFRLGRDGYAGPIDAERRGDADTHVHLDRLQGITEGLIAQGVSPDQIYAYECPDNHGSAGAAAAEYLLSTHPEITALVATPDVLALGAYDQATERGLSVPGDLSIAGFDGTPEALARNLTTVIQPGQDKGRECGVLLHEAINDYLSGAEADTDGVDSTVILPTRFAPGATTAAPA